MFARHTRVLLAWDMTASVSRPFCSSLVNCARGSSICSWPSSSLTHEQSRVDTNTSGTVVYSYTFSQYVTSVTDMFFFFFFRFFVALCFPLCFSCRKHDFIMCHMLFHFLHKFIVFFGEGCFDEGIKDKIHIEFTTVTMEIPISD